MSSNPLSFFSMVSHQKGVASWVRLDSLAWTISQPLLLASFLFSASDHANPDLRVGTVVCQGSGLNMGWYTKIDGLCPSPYAYWFLGLPLIASDQKASLN